MADVLQQLALRVRGVGTLHLAEQLLREDRAEARRDVIEAVRQFVANDPEGGGRDRTLMFLDGLDFVEAQVAARDVAPSNVGGTTDG